MLDDEVIWAIEEFMKDLQEVGINIRCKVKRHQFFIRHLTFSETTCSQGENYFSTSSQNEGTQHLAHRISSLRSLRI